jgi:hypothetical protein
MKGAMSSIGKVGASFTTPTSISGCHFAGAAGHGEDDAG